MIDMSNPHNHPKRLYTHNITPSLSGGMSKSRHATKQETHPPTRHITTLSNSSNSLHSSKIPGRRQMLSPRRRLHLSTLIIPILIHRRPTPPTTPIIPRRSPKTRALGGINRSANRVPLLLRTHSHLILPPPDRGVPVILMLRPRRG